MKSSYWHYFLLAGILLVSALLRFSNLALSPLWLDEVYTAIFSLGQGFASVPRNQFFPISTIDSIFTLNPTSCHQIAQFVITQDNHPPLFFCGLHLWLKMISGLDIPLTWGLRALPALLGVGQIGIIYAFNRVAFSPAAGLMGAALMAVSPFHVYLSQEARHYTAPMLCVSLALLGLIQIGNHLKQAKIQPWLWLAWLFVNVVGFYTHYFFLLATVAQVATLLLWMIGHRSILKRRHWMTAGLTIATLLVSYLPWLPTLIDHMGRPETNWLALSRTTWPDYISPIYQELAGWIIMVIALPIERQPLWIIIPMGLLMVLFFGWLMQAAYGRLRRLGHDPKTRLSTHMLLSFTGFVLLQFLTIIYVFGKDLSLAPRYNFVYYPAFCALLGASLVKNSHWQRWSAPFSENLHVRQWLPLVIGGISCIFVIFNLSLTNLTPYNSKYLVDEIALSPTPQIFLMPYEGDTEIALGLSLIWEIDSRDNLQSTPIDWAFLSQPVLDDTASNRLKQTVPRMKSALTEERFDLWLLGFRWQPSDFPASLQVLSQGQDAFRCQTEPDNFSSATLPHQRYRCSPEP